MEKATLQNWYEWVLTSVFVIYVVTLGKLYPSCKSCIYLKLIVWINLYYFVILRTKKLNVAVHLQEFLCWMIISWLRLRKFKKTPTLEREWKLRLVQPTASAVKQLRLCGFYFYCHISISQQLSCRSLSTSMSQIWRTPTEAACWKHLGKLWTMAFSPSLF